MLVLSRKQKQQIKIGDDVVVTVLQIKGGSVRIGIEAPREIHVMRGELEELREPVENRVPVAAVKKLEPSPAAQSNENQEDEAEPAVGNILELKLHGVDEEGAIIPTRLTEIANQIPSLHLPR